MEASIPQPGLGIGQRFVAAQLGHAAAVITGAAAGSMVVAHFALPLRRRLKTLTLLGVP